jgi:hypothetical protein
MTRKAYQMKTLALLVTAIVAGSSYAGAGKAPPAPYALASVSFEVTGGGPQSGWSLRVDGTGTGMRVSHNPLLPEAERSQFKVDPSEVFELLQRCYREGVFDLNSAYGPPLKIRLREDGVVDTLVTVVADASWSSLRIRIDGYEKSISWLKGFGNPPPVIEELEQRIEALEAEASGSGGSSNHRLDPPHSGVTALAQGRKRRATGRAGQAER